MAVLPSIISAKVSQPFVLLQSTAAQSCLPIMRSIIEKAVTQRTLLLICFLHSPKILVTSEQLQSTNLRLLDWTSQVSGYTDDCIDFSEELLKVVHGMGLLASPRNLRSPTVTQNMMALH